MSLKVNLGLTIVLLLGLSLRALAMLRPIAYDEAYTFLHFVKQPLNIGLADYHVPNNHLLNTLLAHFSVMIFGNTTWGLRLPVFFFGGGLIYITYLLWNRLANQGTALLAAAMVAVSHPLISYSADARGYIINTFFFISAFYIASYLLEIDEKKYWIVFSIFIALSFYAVPTMLYGFGMIYLWIILCSFKENCKSERTKILKRVGFSLVFTSVLTILSYLPVMLYLSENEVPFGAQQLSFITIMKALIPYGLRIFSNWGEELPYLFHIIFLILGLGAIITICLKPQNEFSPKPHRIIFLWLSGFWPACALLITRIAPPYERVWVFLLPLFFGLAAYGLTVLFKLAIPSKAIHKNLLFVLCSLSVILIMGVSSYDKLEYSAFSKSRNPSIISKLLNKHTTPGSVLGVRGALMEKLKFYSASHQRNFLNLNDFIFLNTAWKLNVIQINHKFELSKILMVAEKADDIVKMRKWIRKYYPTLLVESETVLECLCSEEKRFPKIIEFNYRSIETKEDIARCG